MPIHLNPNSRRGKVVIVRNSYDYVPSIMLDGKYRMWWGGGVAGDHILYSESNDLNGPWSEPCSVFQPTGNGINFDGLHTCDPSVIRVGGKYYLYYGGLSSETFGTSTRIGVAESRDGFSWVRLNGGNPIIVPNGNIDNFPNKYGAGQPSVTFVDGYFYLIYTDSTGKASNRINGAGQYVVRSPDPTFQSGIEELTVNGFKLRRSTTAVTTEYSLIDAFSVDWQFVDLLDSFLVVTHNAANETHLTFFNKSFSQVIHQDSITASPWTEGPGIVCRPDRHAVPSRTHPANVPIDVFRSVGAKDPNTWDLAYVGMDLETELPADKLPYCRLYEGCGIKSSGLPLALVVEGVRLQFSSSAPFFHLTRNVFDVDKEVYEKVPIGASMAVGSRVLGVEGKPAAFLLDDGRLWKVDCIEVITANGSFIDFEHPKDYIQREQAGKFGPNLNCIK
jgi:hypothetical protein